jgi:GMP synthase (glutamine-hydrolysing)
MVTITKTDIRPILILKTGTAVDSVREALGDFEDWFKSALGERFPVTVLDCTLNKMPGDDESFSAIIVTGSAAMVSHREPWSETTGAWLKAAVEAGVPTLAVCYGHQLLAQAMGGTVGPNPNGRQIGTSLVRLTPGASEDLLFSGLPMQFCVQASHVESVLELPDSAVRLAHNEFDPNYAYRIAEKAWGIQFHPEFSAQATRGYIEARRAALTAEGLDPEHLRGTVIDTPLSHALINRFAQLARSEAVT